MTTSAQNPALDAELSALKRRVTDLERALADRNRLDRPDTTWVLAGPLYEIEFPPYAVPQRRTYWQAAAELGTPSTDGAVVMTFSVGGVVLLTVSIPEGVSSLRQPIDLTVSRDAVIVAELTDPGDAADITVALRT